MPATATQAAPEHIRAFVQEYFDAWKGTDEDRILAYYSDDVVIHLPTGTLTGKLSVRDSFVRPFIAGFPNRQTGSGAGLLVLRIRPRQESDSSGADLFRSRYTRATDWRISA